MDPQPDDATSEHPCHLKLYSTRKIQPGEELIANYTSFMADDMAGWQDLGLLAVEAEEGSSEEAEEEETESLEEVEESFKKDHTLYTEDQAWTTFSTGDLYWWLDCEEEHHHEENPLAWSIHNQSTWELLRQTYRDIVGSDSSIPATDDSLKTGFHVATEVRNTPE